MDGSGSLGGFSQGVVRTVEVMNGKAVVALRVFASLGAACYVRVWQSRCVGAGFVAVRCVKARFSSLGSVCLGRVRNGVLWQRMAVMFRYGVVLLGVFEDGLAV